MRLLFVIGNLSDYHVPRYEALAKLCAARGHEVALVEVFGKSDIYRFPQSRRDAFFTDCPWNAITLIQDADEADSQWSRIGSGLLSALRRIAPDVVVTLGYNTRYSMLLLLLKLLKKQFALIYMSDSKADDGRRHALKERLKRILVSRFDAALVAGEKHRAYASSLGIPMTRSRVGFDVIDVDFFSKLSCVARDSESEIRSDFNLPARYILCVSRFVKRKNIALLIEAFCRSGVYATGLSLVLVGQGPCEPEIRHKIDRLGINSRIMILRSVANQDMPGLYSLADFVVLASEFDQWGLCISEAFAAGKPAIVTRTCGVANELVIDGVNGLIVEPGKVTSLASAIRQLARNAPLRERFARNAVSSIAYWTPTLFATNVIELAESLAATSLSAHTVA